MNGVLIGVPPPFNGRGRGPGLKRWLYDSDLLFADSNEGFASLPGDIEGALVEGDAWVIFHGLQVFQVVPDEVNSGWYLPDEPATCGSNVWQIEESAWLKSFDQQHLAEHKHFVVEFYEEIVEVICRELLFGNDGFELQKAIDTYPQLNYAYLRRAMAMEKTGNVPQAIADYERYIFLCSRCGEEADYAVRCLQSLRQRDGR